MDMREGGKSRVDIACEERVKTVVEPIIIFRFVIHHHVTHHIVQ